MVERAFDVGEFDGPALIHNLPEGDYAKPLDEVRDPF